MNGLARGWAVLLVASLATNLFVAGFVLAKAARGDRALPATVAEQAQPAPAKAPPATPRAMYEQHRQTLRPTMVAVRKANEAVTAAMMAEPFDPQQLEAALERLRATTLASQQAVHGAMLEAVTAMSAEQRGEFAQASKRVPAERVFLGR